MSGNIHVRLYVIRTAAAFGLCFGIPAEAGAGPAPEIVVSATRSDRSLQSVGSSLSVLTAEELEQGQYAFVVDALRRAPGAVVAQNGGPGGVASIRLRGSGSGQTLVVIDGVRANDPAAPQGGFNAANLSVAGVGNIEILRGPQGLVWGADAIGGVVAIETAAADGRRLEAFAEGGSYGTARAALALSAGARETAFLRTEAFGVATDGFSRAAIGSEADGFRTVGGSLHAGARLFGAFDGAFTARVQHSVADIDGFPPPAFSLDDTAETERTDEFSLSGRVSHRRDGATGVSGTLTLGFADIDRANFDADAQTFSADGRRLSAAYVLDYRATARLSFTVGAEGERQSVDVSGIDTSARRGGAFAIAEWRAELAPASALTLSAGVRRDEFSNFNGATTARAAAAWSLGDRWILRGSWGEGFRAPSLFELNFSQFGVIPNPDLRPERAQGYDAGAEWRSSGEAPRLAFRATWFDTRTRDLIDFSFAQNGFFNVNRSRAKGIEAQAEWRPAEWLAVDAGYTFLDAVDLETGALALRQPRHRGTATLSVAPNGRMSLAVSLFANGRERDAPADNAGYARLDVRGAFRLSPKVEVFGRIENATDTDYEDVSGFAETGRALYAGARVKL